MVRKRSSAWAFFQEIGSGAVRCLLCSDRLMRPEYGATTNMLRHLRTKHPNEFHETKDRVQGNRSSNLLPDVMTDEQQSCSGIEMDIMFETDGDSNAFTAEKTSTNGTQETEHEDSDKQTSDDPLTGRRRSWIWSHFESFDGSARCRICSERLQACKGGSTGNMHRHMSAKHPEVFKTPISHSAMKRSSSDLRADKETSDDPSAGRRRSWIWSHFELMDGSARCRLCSENLQACKGGSTGNMHRHMSAKHPEVFKPTLTHSSMKRLSVPMEDGDSDSVSLVNVAETMSAVTDIHGAAQDVSAGDHQKVDDHAVGRRHSWIWSHFDLLDDLAAVRCRICFRTLQDNGGTSNLHRHMSKKHPHLCQTRLSHSSAKRPMPVMMEDGDSDCVVAADEGEVNSSMNDIQEAGQDLPTEDGQKSKRKRSWIWRHFNLLDGLAAVHCRICSRKLQSNGGTSNLIRHLSKKHPQLLRTQQPHSSLGSDVNDGSSAQIEDTRQGVPVELMAHEKTGDFFPAGSERKLIWRHFDLLESLAAARCRICMKKMQYLRGSSTRNLFRHMSKRHPQLCSQLTDRSNFNGDALMTVETESDRLKKEKELIEVLRTAQRKEADAVEEEKVLLQRLQAENAREAEAAKQHIESLRRAQQEEAEDLSRQKEELQKEKEEVQKEREELQKRWEELRKEREKLLLFSDGLQDF